jgi:3-oxoacyl-[acyl-carrier-protein] synthase II
MGAIVIVASGAVSPLGAGVPATSVGGAHHAPSSLVDHDPELSAKGLKKPRTARVPASSLHGSERRPEALLVSAARGLVEELDRSVPRWRDLRLALCVGTSAGGSWSLERALELRARGAPIPAELARGALYGGPLVALDACFEPSAPRVSLLGACVASTFAIGLAARWLTAGYADLVIAGGYDALSDFVATGFEVLGATTRSQPAPFRRARDGMALGEGAALLALMRVEDAPVVRAAVLGFGATSDAVHVTAPDPEGKGLARAAATALADAGVDPATIDFVSAHATATPHNDAAEAAALSQIFANGPHPPVHPFKGVIGHTLGAAGALETLAAVDAMRAGLLPAAVGQGPVEPALKATLLETNQPGRARHCLKLSAAFGGANAALVLGAEAPSGAQGKPALRAVRELYDGELVREPDPELLATRTRLDELRRSRLDRASALAVTAVARALVALPALDPWTTAVVVGTFAASLEADELFDARRRERGAAGAEPRRFPATSPNLPGGWCTLAFDLRGPSIAVGGGPHAFVQALVVAYDLVSAGDADRALVISCDDVGEVTLELCRAAGLAPPTDGARLVVLGAGVGGRPFARPDPAHH